MARSGKEPIAGPARIPRTTVPDPVHRPLTSFSPGFCWFDNPLGA
jgi:hypothetical protein